MAEKYWKFEYCQCFQWCRNCPNCWLYWFKVDAPYRAYTPLINNPYQTQINALINAKAIPQKAFVALFCRCEKRIAITTCSDRVCFWVVTRGNNAKQMKADPCPTRLRHFLGGLWLRVSCFCDFTVTVLSGGLWLESSWP